MAKISTFMISMVVVALAVTVFGTYYANIATSYDVTLDENTTATIESFNKLEDLQATTQEINQTLFSTSVSGTDLIGKFLGSGFNVLKLVRQSFSTFYSLSTQAVSAVGLPGIFTDVILTIALLVILFVIASVLVGKDI